MFQHQTYYIDKLIIVHKIKEKNGWNKLPINIVTVTSKTL